MEAVDLRDILVKLLADEIGTYTTESGKTYPAVRISPPMVNPSWVIQGLEIIVFLSPYVTADLPLTGAKLQRREWVVELCQFDESQSVQSAIDKIERYFTHTQIRIKNQTLNDYEKARVAIYDPRFLEKPGILT